MFEGMQLPISINILIDSNSNSWKTTSKNKGGIRTVTYRQCPFQNFGPLMYKYNAVL